MKTKQKYQLRRQRTSERYAFGAGKYRYTPATNRIAIVPVPPTFEELMAECAPTPWESARYKAAPEIVVRDAYDRGAHVDAGIHETVDTGMREVDLADVGAAYEDLTGYRLGLEFKRTGLTATEWSMDPDQYPYRWRPEPSMLEEIPNWMEDVRLVAMRDDYRRSVGVPNHTRARDIGYDDYLGNADPRSQSPGMFVSSDEPTELK